MAITNPFSMSTMFNALQDLRFTPPRETMMNEEPPMIPPPLDGDSLFCCETSAGLTDPEISEMDLAWVFNFMTRSEDVPRFKDVISMLDREQLQRMVYILTSDSRYFMDIARNKNGSKSLQKLMGKSDDVDAFFYEVIMRLFFQVMTDKHASYVAIKGMQVFQQVRKELLYENVLQYALHLARDEHGCIALNEVITDLDDPYYRNQLLDIVAYNALLLSNDAYGNFVVQHVLKLYDLRSTRNIAVNLRGHFVELSFKKYGSYIVERLLEAEDSVMELVVMDLLECEGERLMRLARSEYGNFVVKKGLLFTRDIFTAHLFYGLVYKLMPFRHLLPRSPGRNIATILDSLVSFHDPYGHTS